MPTTPFKSDGFNPDISPTVRGDRPVSVNPDFTLVRRIDNGACLDVNSDELYYLIPRDGHPYGEANQ